MATEYTINGAVALIAPVEQLWSGVKLGTDHEGAPIWQAAWDVTLHFPECSVVLGNQWLEAASSGSANVTILQKYSLNYTDLSGVHLEVVAYPTVSAGNYSPFSIVVRGETL